MDNGNINNITHRKVKKWCIFIEIEKENLHIELTQLINIPRIWQNTSVWHGKSYQTRSGYFNHSVWTFPFWRKLWWFAWLWIFMRTRSSIARLRGCTLWLWTFSWLVGKLPILSRHCFVVSQGNWCCRSVWSFSLKQSVQAEPIFSFEGSMASAP